MKNGKNPKYQKPVKAISVDTVIFKTFREVQNYIKKSNSDKALQHLDDGSEFSTEDAVDVYINTQRQAQDAKQPSKPSKDVITIEQRYMWLSKGS